MNDFLKVVMFFIITSSLYSQVKDSIRVENLEEVYISSVKTSAEKVVSGQIELNEKAIEEAPVVLGEKDVFKILQLTPGVQQGSEGQSGLLVRGGNSGMNLTFIEGIYLHNLSHLGGLFSVVNSDFIQKVTFDKGGFDAMYGGRISSVTNIEVKKKYDSLFVKGGIGLVTSKVTLGVPVHKLKTKLLFSSRRSYFDLIQPLFFDGIGNENTVLGNGRKYYFYDYLINSYTKLNKKNKVTLLYYKTKDVYSDKDGVDTNSTFWENNLYGFNWDSKLSKGVKNHLSVSKSNYDLSFDADFFSLSLNLFSKYNQLQIKDHLRIKIKNHVLKTGFLYEGIENLPKKLLASIENTELHILNQNPYKINTLNFFLDDEYQILDNLKVKLGLRYSNFELESSDVFKQYDKAVLEPRFNLNYEFKNQQYLKFSYQTLYQFVHQSNIASYSTPIDFLIPSNKSLKPQKGTQYSLSYARDFTSLSLDLSVYYKKINNYTEFLQGSINTLFLENIYDDIVVGVLYSSGLELSTSFKFLKKVRGNVNYTFSRTFAKFKEINNGDIYPVVFDRPHNFNTNIHYDLNAKLAFGMSFIYASGQNFTPPEQIRVVDGSPIISFGERNSVRYPSYHRMNMFVNYMLKKTKRKSSQLNLTLYNIYNRKNPFYVSYSTESIEASTGGIETNTEKLFPFIPTINWMFSFK